MKLEAAGLVRKIFEAAFASAQSQLCVPPHLPMPSEVTGRLIVSGADKASAAIKGGRMAAVSYPARVIHLLLSDVPGNRPVDIASGDVDSIKKIAGAVMRPPTLKRVVAKGLSPRASLDANDGQDFFQTLADSVITGSTLTNVNDLRLVPINR